ncbi:MAG: ArnT family glycosyltransferase [Gemmataceae bacterium]
MPRRLFVLLIALFALRIWAVQYAFDRRPVITNNDEIYWAEPAWALDHGDGYRLPCCDGMLFGDFYPQHPPLYVLILAGSFRLFGFTPGAMRLPSIAAHIASVAMLLVLLWKLRRLRVLDNWGVAMAALLATTDFSTMYVSRWGRPDPFTGLFALSGFVLLVAGHMRGAALQWRAWLASVLVGLSLATHTIAVFYLGLFVIALWLLRKRLGYVHLIGCLLLPILIFVGFWIGVFGDRWLVALQEHRELAGTMGGATKPPYRSLQLLSGSINQKEFLQAGGTTAVMILLSFVCFVLRGLGDQRSDRRWLILGVGLAGQFALIIAITGLGITRCSIYYPFTLVVFALLVTRCPTWLRRPALWGAILVAAAEIGQTAHVLYGTHRDYAIRSPHRHDALMNRLASYRRVAVIPVLWFQARERGLDFQLVDLSVPRQWDEWTRRPHPFEGFDAVVLEADHLLGKTADLADIKPIEFPEPMAEKGLLLYELHPPR